MGKHLYCAGSDKDEPGGPLHHSLYAQVQQDLYADFNKGLDNLRRKDSVTAFKRRGRPRKYITSGKPIGRPRKFCPPIGDPIKFLQAASLSGLFKVNDENAQISGISSFLNPNFRNTDKPPEVKAEPPDHPSQPLPAAEPLDAPKGDPSDGKNCFACQFCGKSYKKKKHYNRHVNFECINTEPRFLCTMCSYKARRKEHLIRHLRSHIGDMMNSTDYGLMSVLKEDVSITPANQQSAEEFSVSSSPNLHLGGHNGQVYTSPSFNYVGV